MSNAPRTASPPRPSWRSPAALWGQGSRSDVVAGLVVAGYLVPQCMAYAEVAGLGPAQGLVAAVGGLVAYALLGTSSQLSVGPESSSALLVGAVLASVASTAPGASRSDLAAGMCFAVGLLALAARIVRVGFLADLLSRPVLVGYLIGVAVAMVIGQLGNVTGVEVAAHDPLPRLREFLGATSEVHGKTVGIAAAVALALVVLDRLSVRAGPIIVIAGAALAASVADLPADGVAVVGSLPRAFTSLGVPDLGIEGWRAVLGGAVVVTIVAFADNVLTARAFAYRTGDRIDAHQELVALGGANVAAGLLGGFPVSSSASRTALSIGAGGRSQATSVVAAVAVVLVVSAGGDALRWIPMPALGALVIVAATRLVSWSEVRRIAAFRRREGLLVLASAVGVVTIGLLGGVVAAVALSAIDLFARLARAHDGVLGAVPGLAGMHDVDDHADAVIVPGLVVYRYDAPLFFANAEDFRTRLLDAVDRERTPVSWVVLNMEANVEIDLTAADVLAEVRDELDRRGIVLALARVKQDLADLLDRSGLGPAIGEDRIFPTLPTALDAFHAAHPDRRR